jgi:hypothetical protein
MTVLRWLLVSGGALVLAAAWTYARASINPATTAADLSMPSSMKAAAGAFTGAALIQAAFQSRFLWTAFSIAMLLFGFQVAFPTAKQFFDEYPYLNFFLPYFFGAGISTTESKGSAGQILGGISICFAVLVLAKDIYFFNNLNVATAYTGLVIDVPARGRSDEFELRKGQTIRWSISGNASLRTTTNELVFGCDALPWPGVRSTQGGVYYFTSCGNSLVRIQITSSQ